MFGRRPDAKLVTELSTMRRVMPYISPRRNDSLFYMMQEIEVEAALEFLAKKNVDRPPDRPITLFHLFLRSTAQAFYLRPGVNRFVISRVGSGTKRAEVFVTGTGGIPTVSSQGQGMASRKSLKAGLWSVGAAPRWCSARPS